MQQSKKDISSLETKLDNFDPALRKQALLDLLELVQRGDIPVKPMKDIANLHCHSFFSYNGYGYSPTHLAWLGKKQGVQFMGVVDFDVLDAVDEFLDACESVGVCGVAGLETRVFLPEFEHIEINSPGEPGMCYHMGTGFTTNAVPEEASAILDDLRKRAENRNREMLERINSFLTPLRIDYDTEVLPLTPKSNGTERHMVQVIAQKADDTISETASFWAEKLSVPSEEIAEIKKDRNRYKNFLRSKLMKRGSVGYVQPTQASFPTVEEFHTVMKSVGALPCSAWLDGTSKGEQRIEELLHILMEKGVAALNIVPDRNWNIKDPQEKADKLDKLYAVVDLAQRWNLPVLVGTEMNKFGQKLVDDFNTPELAPIREIFLRGATILYGHTQLQRYWGIGMKSAWADKYFSTRSEKNNFYFKLGGMIKPGFKDKSKDLITFKPQAVINHFIHNH